MVFSAVWHTPCNHDAIAMQSRPCSAHRNRRRQRAAHHREEAKASTLKRSPSPFYIVCTYIILRSIDFFLRIGKLLSSGLGSFLTLSAAGHAGGAPEHHRARLGPGRAPSRVFCTIKSRESWQVITGSLSAELEPSKTLENPCVSCCAPLL